MNANLGLILAIGAVITMLGVPMRAGAIPLTCDGTVPTILVYSSGDVMIRPTFRNDYVTLCNLQGTRNGIDLVTCAIWLTLAQRAQESRSSISVRFSEVPSGTCGTVGTYDTTEPVVFFLTNQP